MVVVADVDGGQDAVHVRVVVVQLLRDLQLANDLVEGGVLVGAPAVAPGLPEDAAAPGVRMRVFGVELDARG